MHIEISGWFVALILSLTVFGLFLYKFGKLYIAAIETACGNDIVTVLRGILTLVLAVAAIGSGIGSLVKIGDAWPNYRDAEKRLEHLINDKNPSNNDYEQYEQKVAHIKQVETNNMILGGVLLGVAIFCGFTAVVTGNLPEAMEKIRK